MYGCQAPSAPKQAVELRLALSDTCGPEGSVELTVVGEGYYPADDALFVPLSVSEQPQSLPPFPGDTVAYRIEARGGRFEGAGRVRSVAESPLDVLVLPLGRVCGGVELQGPLRPGHVAPLGDSELLWLGTQAAEGSLRLTPSRGAAAAPEAGLFVPRAGASVTTLGDSVVVVGGRQSDETTSAALASYEVFDPASDRFSEVERLELARADHAAVTAADGMVWVAGGRDGERILDSLERVGAGATASTLSQPSDAVALLAHDDGSVVALDFQRESGTRVQHFDPAGQRRIDAPDLPVATAPALVVALPGRRLLSFEVNDEGLTTGRACLRFGTEGDECLDDWLTSFAGLAEASAVALRDGRVLLVGERDGDATLRLVDVGRRVVEAGRLPFVPRWTTLLGDGSVALLGDASLALLREDVLAPTSELPATLLAPDAVLLALDSVEHWRWEGLELIAQSDRAEAHLAAVRFQDVDVEVRSDGRLDVIFGWLGETRTLRIEADSADLFGSELPRASGAPVRIERRGTTWTAHSGEASATRDLPGLAGPVRVSLRAPRAGARVEGLRIERR